MELKAFGRVYSRKTVMCKKIGIREEAFQYYHVYKGLSLEDAITCSKNATIEFNGKEYHSLREMCSNYGAAYVTVLSRLRKGLSLTDSLTLSYDTAKSSRNEVVVCDIIYKNRTEFLTRHHVHYTFFKEYMKANSLDEKTALHNLGTLRNTIANMTNNKNYILYRIPLAIINGTYFEYLADLSKLLNVTTSSLRVFRRRHPEMDMVEIIDVYQKQTLQESVNELVIDKNQSIDLVKLNKKLLSDIKVSISA